MYIWLQMIGEFKLCLHQTFDINLANQALETKTEFPFYIDGYIFEIATKSRQKVDKIQTALN